MTDVPMTAAQAAAALSVSPTTIARWCQDPEMQIPCTRKYGMWFVSSEWVNDLLREWMPAGDAAEQIGIPEEELTKMLRVHTHGAKRLGKRTLFANRAWVSSVARQVAKGDRRRYQGRWTLIPIPNEPAVPLIERKEAIELDRSGNIVGTITRNTQ